jgi:hypothetical protein
MMNRHQPCAIEQVAGSLPAEAALTVVAAFAGGPLAALLPVLSNSLAARRQQARVEAALSDIQRVLAGQSAKIRDLSDEQYKIINEAVLALLHTTQAEKLTYLRSVVQNALTYCDVGPQESVLLSRIVRDISSQEIEFLIRTFAFNGVQLIATTEQDEVNLNVIRVDPASTDALSVSGLLSLGLLHSPETGWDGGTMRFTNIVAKLIALLQRTDDQSVAAADEPLERR